MTATAPEANQLLAGAVPPAALLGRRRRPRLGTTLDALLEAASRLAVVAAPPGYGKSVAVAGWIADRGIPCAWLTLERADGDPTRLCRDLLAALEAGRPGSAALAAHVGAAQDVSALAGIVLGAIAAADTELVLVLDDYQAVDTPAAAALVRRLVERMPPFGHPIVVSREDPDLPLGRLRAHGALVELRADELRFTADEAASFLADAGIEPDPSLVARLAGRTEGWAAALQLAALTMRSTPDPVAAVDALSGTHRYLIDYLADEVMAELDEDLRVVLVRASIADRFTVDLLALLTGRPDAADLLDRAERANLFVVPLDASRRWFRLHGLFADYLRARLGPGVRAELHRLAAGWFDTAGHGREAVDHGLASGDGELLGRLVARHGRAALEAGELRTLAGWLAAVPPERLGADDELIALDAWVRFYTGDLAGAAAVAERAIASTEPTTPAHGRLLVLLGLLGTTTRADAEALALRGVALVGDDDLFRSLGQQAAGLAQLARGDVAGSVGTLRAALVSAQAAGHPMAVLPAVNPLGHALEASGRRDESEAIARTVLEAYRGPSDEPLAIAWSAQLVLGIALYEGGEVAEARRELERGLAAATELGVGRPVLGWALPTIALARQATGDPAGALAILDHAAGPVPAFPSLAGETEARIRLAQGDLAAASRWADVAGPEAPEGSPLLALLRASAETTVARVRLAEGRPADALAAATAAGAAFRGWGSVPDQVSTLLLAAEAHLGMGGGDDALAGLGDAVRLAAPGGYVRRFVDDGAALAGLLPGVRAIAPAFVLRVDDAIRETSPTTGRARRGTTVSAALDGRLIESLTGRELDVLRRMATGASNAQLAEELGVSAGTAKWHVAHILGKLAARSRTEAVIRGQQLGLI